MPDMGIVKDMIHDLMHRSVNTTTGEVSQSSAPNKPAASSAPAGDWVQRAQAKAQADRNSVIDKQISDAGG